MISYPVMRPRIGLITGWVADLKIHLPAKFLVPPSMRTNYLRLADSLGEGFWIPTSTLMSFVLSG